MAECGWRIPLPLLLQAPPARRVLELPKRIKGAGLFCAMEEKVLEDGTRIQRIAQPLRSRPTAGPGLAGRSIAVLRSDMLRDAWTAQR